MFQNDEVRLGKSVLYWLNDRKRLRQEVNEEKQSKRKQVDNINTTIKLMVIQRNIY